MLSNHFNVDDILLLLITFCLSLFKLGRVMNFINSNCVFEFGTWLADVLIVQNSFLSHPLKTPKTKIQVIRRFGVATHLLVKTKPHGLTTYTCLPLALLRSRGLKAI